MSRRNYAAEIEALRAEYDTVTGQIVRLMAGPVRLALKKQRNAIYAKAIDIRGLWIEEEARSENPRHVPRIVFGEEQIRNRVEEERGDSWI